MGLPFRTALTTAAPLAAALLLGGCQTVFDAVGVTVPLSAGEMRVYDGSYQGRVRQVAAGPGCPTEDGERVLMVGDGVLWYAYSPVTFFASPVRYDGVIEADSGDTHMTGAITGNHLEATVKSASCETKLSMNYIFNH